MIAPFKNPTNRSALVLEDFSVSEAEEKGTLPLDGLARVYPGSKVLLQRCCGRNLCRQQLLRRPPCELRSFGNIILLLSNKQIISVNSYHKKSTDNRGWIRWFLVKEFNTV